MCRFYDPQDPQQYTDRCPDPDAGTPMLVSRVAHVQLAKGGSFTVPTRVTGARQVDVQIANYGDRADQGPDSPLQVSVTTSGGRRVNLTMPQDALDITKNRATSDENGTYVLGTLRIPVPADLASQTITSVVVTAPKGGQFALRAIDVRARAAAKTSGPAAGPAPTSSTPTSSTTSASPASAAAGRPVTGPIVQTDSVPQGGGASTIPIALGTTLVAGGAVVSRVVRRR